MKYLLICYLSLQLMAFEIPTDNIEEFNNVEEVKQQPEEKQIIKRILPNTDKIPEKQIINKVQEQSEPVVSKKTSELGSSKEIVKLDFEVDSNGELISEKNSFVPITYNNVKYIPQYEWFSLVSINEEGYLKLLSKYKLTPELIEKNLNNISSQSFILGNALYYDFIKRQPEIAENFYLKLALDYNTRNLMANYLIRTGRPDVVERFLRKGDCLKFGSAAECNYHLGVVEYLLTGQNKNRYIKKARQELKKADILYLK